MEHQQQWQKNKNYSIPVTKNMAAMAVMAAMETTAATTLTKRQQRHQQ